MDNIKTKNERITAITCQQLTSEKAFEIKGKIFIDATGDATLSHLAGAEYMHGREGKDVYGEQFAPDESDEYTMGSSLLFKAVDTGKAVEFKKLPWANTYTEKDLPFRDHSKIKAGYWWIELGGDDLDTIDDAEQIRDELLKVLYGVWDHIKNSGHHNAENNALDWVGFLPGKRESRRVTGDYVLREQDLLEGRFFEDGVAYGGWPMDMHAVGGIRSTEEPTKYIDIDGLYSIPYRCLYSKNIPNLMIAGRAISCSRLAFGSTRVMATCAVVGQAIGSAAAIAIREGITPREVMNYIDELQQTLIKDDCYIPGIINKDSDDCARSAKITCSSSVESADCKNVINGLGRTIEGKSNCWISKKLESKAEWLSLEFDKKIQPSEIRLKFDSNLSNEIMPTMMEPRLIKQIEGIPPQLVKDYSIVFYHKGKIIKKIEERGNYLRFRVHAVKEKFECDKIVLEVLSTHSDEHARLFEIRVYE